MASLISMMHIHAEISARPVIGVQYPSLPGPDIGGGLAAHFVELALNLPGQ